MGGESADGGINKGLEHRTLAIEEGAERMRRTLNLEFALPRFLLQRFPLINLKTAIQQEETEKTENKRLKSSVLRKEVAFWSIT